MRRSAIRSSFSASLPLGLLLCAFLALLLAASACAPLQQEGPRISPQKAESTWAAFWSGQDELASLAGASIQGSLNIFTPEDSRRITLELWGNPPAPLRLHLRAGIGTTISMWEIRQNRVLIFFPRNNTAYTAANSAQASAAMGLRLPFSLPRMMQLLTGDWKDLLWREYERAEVVPGQGYAYYPRGQARIGRVVLDDQGRIVSLSGDRPYQWSLKRKDLTERKGRILSRRIELTTERDEELILRVKEFNPRKTPWPRADLRLSLPPDTMVRALGSVDADAESTEQ